MITEVLTGKSVNEMTTEIRFFIANARVKGYDAFKLNVKKVFNEGREAKRFASIGRILYTIKREGLIQLYIHSSEIDGASTEAAYINNKYPSLLADRLEECYIIKL